MKKMLAGLALAGAMWFGGMKTSEASVIIVTPPRPKPQKVVVVTTPQDPCKPKTIVVTNSNPRPRHSTPCVIHVDVDLED